MIPPYITAFLVLFIIGIPCPVLATQMHGHAEGILVHQVGHIFFLVSMVTLYVTIHRRKLYKNKAWREFQYSALFFVLWNLDALIVHFLDNQSGWIETQILSIQHIHIKTLSGSSVQAFVYYIMRLDHLFCLPGMFFLWHGLSLLLTAHKSDHETGPDPSETAFILNTGNGHKITDKPAVEDKESHDTGGVS